MALCVHPVSLCDHGHLAPAAFALWWWSSKGQQVRGKLRSSVLRFPQCWLAKLPSLLCKCFFLEFHGVASSILTPQSPSWVLFSVSGWFYAILWIFSLCFSLLYLQPDWTNHFYATVLSYANDMLMILILKVHPRSLSWVLGLCIPLSHLPPLQRCLCVLQI